MNQILLTAEDKTEQGTYLLKGDRARVILENLALRTGDTVRVGLLDGPKGTAEIVAVAIDSVELACGALEDDAVLSPDVDIICAIPRPKTLKKILYTIAMMGVRRLHLVRSARVEKSYFDSPLLESNKYTPVLYEGLMQGKNTRLPRISIHPLFRPFIEDDYPELAKSYPAKTAGVIASFATERSLAAIKAAAMDLVVLAIGPEGGWVPFEIDLMEKAGFVQCTLGRYTLRVEHAVTAALAQLDLLRMMP